MNKVAQRMGRINPSPILSVVAKAAELKAQGIDVVDLSIGEPDFETPDNVKQAGIAAIQTGATKYTSITGLPDLRKAIAEKFKRENGLDYAVQEVTHGCGGKQVIFNAMLATLDEGDEVIVPAPYWASYPDIIRLAGGQPVIVPCGQEAGFKLMPEQLAAALGPRTRWLILNSPSNPTGAVLDDDELAALAAVLRKHPDAMILSDEIYEHILYDRRAYASFAALFPDLRDRTLTMNGVSKAYSMTGWRLGYAAGPRALIQAMNDVLGHTATHTSTITQYAAIEALRGPQQIVAERCRAFERRRDLIVGLLNDIPGIRCLASAGAFYVYPSVAGLLGSVRRDGRSLQNDQDVALYFLEEAHVATVHGAGFGLSPHLRLSYATSEEAIGNACRRMAAAVAKLRGGERK
ncbi:pyridoxal phosphate-dependent aminotransferase [Bradyrhizobium sp. HKCCYLS2038]|uniref:pyridoxal phosphate-dependent aminotransferase n=1 Tax=unclassified Bradyrhizobium TaxID=2631580 RepID=UPI003EBE2B6C